MLDEKSRKLLIELDYKSRDSISQIGKKLHLSKDSAINRLKKLEEKGFVKGFYSVIDYPKIGYDTYRLYVQLNGLSRELEENIMIFLKKFICVRFVSFLSGEFDLIVTFQVREILDLNESYSKFINEFSSFIIKKEIALIIEQKHFLQPILKKGEKNKEFVTKTATQKIQISDVEINLIRLLAFDARKSFVELSQQLVKKPNTLLYSLRGLEKKKIILGYRPRLDFNKLGLSHYIISIQRKGKDMKKINLLEKFFLTIGGIIYVNKGVSSFDYELEVVVEDTSKLREIIFQLNKNFSNEISKISSSLILNTKTLNYCPF